MDKLQFDSFYKFLVSIGILLIIAPIFLLHFLISGSYDIVISETELSSLSSISKELIEHKMMCLKFVYQFLPIFCIVLIVTGLFLFIYGCYKWNTIQQSAQDKLTNLSIKEKQLNIEKMSATEIAEKMVSENIETTIENETCSSITTSARPSTTATIRKAFEIEDRLYMSISNKLGKKYLCHQNVRIHNQEYDIIAESIDSSPDILYEIKYFPRDISLAKISSIFEQTKERGKRYKENTNRDYQLIIIIVTSDEGLPRLKSKISQHDFSFNNEIINLEIFSENFLPQ